MVMVADVVDAVVGVDTHTDTHTAAILNPLGAVLAQIQVSADAAGVAALQAWAAGHAPVPRLLWAIEGTRSHGLGLTRTLRAAGARVVEAPPPTGRGRRRGGKSDPLDAVAAARGVLAIHRPVQQLGQPRADGNREALRLLLATRRHYTDVRTATVNLFKSLVLTAEDDLRGQLRGLSTAGQLRLVITGQLTPATTLEQRIRREQLTALAGQIRQLDQAITTNLRQLRQLVTTMMASLLTLPGVGPVTAAVLLTSWSHKNRIHSEAAYAALGGASPVPASSGRTTRHRLNRGGDRTLNAALHTIAMTRRRIDPATNDYIQRRRTEGKTDREALRCLKRYLARHLYRHMQTHATT